jgi:hypothetical protein
MSRQMGHLKRPADALELAQLAQYGARNDATATAADTALGLLGELSSSRVTDRLRELLADTEPHAGNRAIQGLRDRLTAALT